MKYGTEAINGTVLFISFMDVEMVLKLTLLVVTIGYTTYKWYKSWKE